MAVQDQPITINFSKGLDLKSDPKQLELGRFEELQNAVFTVQGQLTKRNGFPKLTTLPNAAQTNLNTLNDNLLATGSDLYAYSEATDDWLNRGSIQPVSLRVKPLVRTSASQSAPDIAVSASGLILGVYSDSGGGAYYQITDATSGQLVADKTFLGVTAGQARAYVLGRYFIVTYTATVSASPHLRYIAVPVDMPNSPIAPADIASTLTVLTAGYDAVVGSNGLYIFYSDTGPSMQVAILTPTLGLTSAVAIDNVSATDVSATLGMINGNNAVWVSYYDSGTQDGYTAAFSTTLVELLAPTQIINGIDINTLTSASREDDLLQVFYEVINDYALPYPTGTETDYVETLSVESDGTVSSSEVILRSVGLASKAFISEDLIYMLVAYGEINQPTYFLIDENGNIYMRLAYSNGGGYASTQVLSNISSVDGEFFAAYLLKTFLAPINKGDDDDPATAANAIYTQTGVNMVRFTINDSKQYSSEVAGCLHLTGGQVWQYDGIKPVELGFHVWPENISSNSVTGIGDMSDQQYYYKFCYEWTDGAGMLHRSAPSLPYGFDVSSPSSMVDLYVPTLRLTYKTTPNPVRIVGYRWSVAQQTYYQFTSIQSPVLNNPAVDYVTIQDDNSDADILGNTILYTTGGIVENIAPPSFIDTALWQNRLIGIDAENPNVLWYSKEILQSTPVEFSDLFTLYIAPTTGAQGSTGDAAAISSMDDKLIVFKEDALYYFTGRGPNSAGSDNSFSEPIFISSAVGSSNPNSIALVPQGLMFKSNKGIWLLDRNLATKYVGDAVEGYNELEVRSALVIPKTTQVRYTLTNNITLMYDYYYDQWGTFSNLRAISSVLNRGYHTYLNEFGQVFRESPTSYLDGSSPVLISFKTSWINVAGLQGYERFRYALLLGVYYSPFKLAVNIGYDYNNSASQSIIVTPENSTPKYGGESVWGGGQPWGGPGNIFRPRIFPERQKCEAFQMEIVESYDASYGVAPGQGLSLSGLNMLVAVKKGARTSKAAQSFG